MTIAELSEFARSWWSVWLMALFIGVVVWAMWPSEKKRQEMREHAMIPLRDDDESDTAPTAR